MITKFEHDKFPHSGMDDSIHIRCKGETADKIARIVGALMAGQSEETILSELGVANELG